MDAGLDRVFRWSRNPGKSRKGLNICCSRPRQHPPLVSASSSSVSGPTSGAACTLAQLLRFEFPATFSGLCWQLTCFTESLPSWWPCAFTATITSSSRSPRFLARPVCRTARRKTLSTKINKLIILPQISSIHPSSVELWNCYLSKCPNKSLF